MSELAGRQAEGVEPIAWVRGNGNLVHRGLHWPFMERKKPGHGCDGHQTLPADAVPLVPATELDEVRKVAEWLQAETNVEIRWLMKLGRWLVAEARWESEVKPKTAGFSTSAFMESLRETSPRRSAYATGSPVHMQRISEWLIAEARWSERCQWVQVAQKYEDTERAYRWLLAEARWKSDAKAEEASRIFRISPDHGGVATRMRESYTRLGAQTAPQLPALDTPEALRYAADVVQAHWAKRPQRVVSDTDAMVTADSLRHLANIDDAAARADAEREARIEKLAERGYSGNMRMLDLKPRWASESPDMRAHWVGWAEWMDDGALDDLGYRLDATEAKP